MIRLLFLLSIQLFFLFYVDACTYGEIRLASGPTSNQGRVELCINETWGTVCDDELDNDIARVVCRQLGYITDGARYFSRAHYGSGTGNIFLDQVECSGCENDLLACSYSPIGNHNCYHTEDIGVSCSSAIDTCTAALSSPTVSIIVSSTDSFCEPSSSSPCYCPSLSLLSYHSSSDTIRETITTHILITTVITTFTLTVTESPTTTEGPSTAANTNNCTVSTLAAIILPLLLIIIIASLLLSMTLIYCCRLRNVGNKKTLDESRLERSGTLKEVSMPVYGDGKEPDGDNDDMTYSPIYNSATSVEPFPNPPAVMNRYQASAGGNEDMTHYEMMPIEEGREAVTYDYVDTEPAAYEVIPGEEENEGTYETPVTSVLRT